jgi:8-oxo-dGTP pyrophosphatase MutT (NUDIX family)
VAVEVELRAIRNRLAGRVHERFKGQATRRAAVAVVLRPGADDTELLLIRRAERAGDPWSGHMAMPGGHVDAGDRDLLSTALRETREEVGLALRPDELLGALDEHAAVAQGRFTGIVIAPFVFAIERDVELSPNHEVAELVWAPLGRMARGEVNITKELEREGRRVTFPAYGLGEHVVWGLTHRVLENLFATLADR